MVGYSIAIANTLFPVPDPIDFDNFNFDEISKYVEFASSNLYMITIWDKCLNQSMSIYDVIVYQYFYHKGERHSKEDINKMSKILQEAGVAVDNNLEYPLC